MLASSTRRRDYMKIKANVSIHNRFDIVVRDAETKEVIQKAQAENIVLDRIYTRLCSFASFFDQIVFGSGTGTPTPDRTTLFNRIGSKSATTEQLIRATPTSQWTRTCRLTSTEYNGQFIREIGISNDTTQINTHALITDAEGNPIELEKTALKIIDIYATVYVTIYDVDWGLRFDGTGLRDYLTGGSVASDSIGLSFVGVFGKDTLWHYQSATRTPNVANKSVKTTAKFRVEHFNNDVQYICWKSTGLICTLPRPGVFESRIRTDVPIGAGDGVKTVFMLPNKSVKDLYVYINGILTTDYTTDAIGRVKFNNPVPDSLPVTASYTCTLIPKNVNNEVDVTMEIIFGGGQPTPVMPPEEEYNHITPPGSSTPIGGDSTYGFYGEVPTTELVNGEDLCTLIGLTAGTLQNSEEPWLKFALDGKILYVAKKTFRHSISWDNINAIGAVFGEVKLNRAFKVRLLSTEEWNLLMYPIHKDHPSGAPNWANYTDQDLLVHNSFGNGSYSWTSTQDGSDRVYRGRYGVSYSYSYTPSEAYAFYGFRPVLEIL
jgi:hypothetical protein